ncbi:MAG: HAMP domain-containing histidine kinase [Alphaproteobacteria bacterium]|nr:HAMP domain-containing histidine kinase [Alphaproteobacteria bacterium]MBL6951910.1 HAMP domain-containing histidine kinase [Alphaproteobacteria bacterium]
MDPLRKRLLPPVALTVVGLLVFVLGASGLSFVHIGASLYQMEETMAERNAALGRAMTYMLAPNIESLLAQAQNAGLGDRLADAEFSQNKKTIRQVTAELMALHPSIFKLAIIDPIGRTVFATDDTQFAADKGDDEGFKSAMAGRVGPSVTFREQLAGTENGQAGRDVLLSYLPLTVASADRPANTVLGVYEIQADITVEKSRIHKTLLLELGIMLVSFAVIFLLLLAIVRVSNLRLINNYRQQKRLAHGVKRAEKADSAKSAFLADISHQLRTPLNAIIGFSEILKDETFGPLGSQQYQSYAEDIHHSGRRLLAIIGDLLDLTQIQSGQAELREEALSLGECLETTTRMLSCQPEAMALAFHSKQDPSLPQLFADPTAIQHILQNLLSNAIKHTLEGSITVTACLRRDRSLEFSVADTGIGMSEDELEQVNQRFNQIEVSWKRDFESAGLGLPLVKALMTQHEGDVSITSEVGVGTTVVCHFPPRRTLDLSRKSGYAA